MVTRKMNHFRRIMIQIILTICLLSSLALLGCSKVNQENYDKLKIRMNYDEVLNILGKPDNCKSILNAKNCVWEESSKKITVKFVANKVNEQPNILDNDMDLTSIRQYESSGNRFVSGKITLIFADSIGVNTDFVCTYRIKNEKIAEMIDFSIDINLGE